MITLQEQNEFNTKVKEAAAKSGCYAMMRRQGPGWGPAEGPGALHWGLGPCPRQQEANFPEQLTTVVG